MIKATLKRIGIGLMYLVPSTLVIGAMGYLIWLLGPASLLVAAVLFISWMIGDTAESTKEHKRYMEEWRNERLER